MKKNFIYKLLTGAVLISGLSGCLKDNSQPDFTKNKPVIELPIGSSSGNVAANSIAASFTVSNTPADYFVWVNYAAPDANSKDVTITLAVDTAALSLFNKTNGKSYTLLPTVGYTLPSNKVTIPAGARKVQFPVKINTAALDPTKTFTLPLAITDGGGYTVSANFAKLITIISLKNKWDGVYTVTGTMTDVVNSGITGQYPHDMQLITQSANVVAVYDPSQNAYGHGILNGGAGSYYGSFSPKFPIDPATNKITDMINYYGRPSTNGRDAILDVSGINAFTMSSDGTKPVSFKVKYIMTENGSNRTFFDETWTYKSAR